MIIAIDFDGTIVDHRFPEIGELKKGARETIYALIESGHEIIIWTCRTRPQHIKPMLDFLNENGIPVMCVNQNVDRIPKGDCTPKIYADLYIDDRNLFHQDNWATIYMELVRRGFIK